MCPANHTIKLLRLFSNTQRHNLLKYIIEQDDNRMLLYIDIFFICISISKLFKIFEEALICIFDKLSTTNRFRSGRLYLQIVIAYFYTQSCSVAFNHVVTQMKEGQIVTLHKRMS